MEQRIGKNDDWAKGYYFWPCEVCGKGPSAARVKLNNMRWNHKSRMILNE